MRQKLLVYEKKEISFEVLRSWIHEVYMNYKSKVDVYTILTTILLFSFIGLTGCGVNEFSYEEWSQLEDVNTYNWDYRKDASRYLIEQELLISLSREEVLTLLGDDVVDAELSTDTICYIIDLDYGTDIDPIYIEYFSVCFDSNDQVVVVVREAIHMK